MIGRHVASRDNNFDVLRLAAASLVLVSHSWALTGREQPSFAGDTLGGVGVTIFFAISGFLVARSWDLDPRPQAFALKRMLRLWPALIVVVVLSACVLGPLLTHVPLSEYFGSPTAKYVSSNIGLHISYALPGVFAHNPYADAVNGSLWTLPVEAKAYLGVLLLGLLGLARRPLVLAALFALLVWMLSAPLRDQPETLRYLFGSSTDTRFLLVFAGGMLLYVFRDGIPLDWRLAAIAGVSAVAVAHSSLAVHSAVWALTVPYLAAAAAYRTPRALRALVRPGDLSYGIYLWAFPVQQTVIAVLDLGHEPGWVLLTSGAATYGLAFLSWRCVEAPALRLKRRFAVGGAARPTHAAA